MIAPTNIWLYFLADSSNRTLSWVNGGVIKNNIPTPLPQHPIGWKDIEIKFGTNAKYWSLQRSFSTQLKFVNDGANIIRHYGYMGKGFEEDLYIIILKWNRDDNKYHLEYRGKLDFIKFSDDPYTGVTISTLEGGLLRYLNANENVTYEIPCDGRNPKAQKVIFDGVNLKADVNYKAPQSNYPCGGSSFQTYLVGFIKTIVQGDTANVILADQAQFQFLGSSSSPHNAMTDKTDVNYNNYLLSFAAPTEVEISGILELQNSSYDSNGNITWLTNGVSGRLRVYCAYNGNVYVIGDQNNSSWSDYKFSIPIHYKATFPQNARVFIYFFFQLGNGWGSRPAINLTPTTNSRLQCVVKSKVSPSTAWFIRPLDLLKSIVNKMTYGKYTANSIYFSDLNNEVATCGDALRNIDPTTAGIDGYNIKKSFSEWFKDYDSGNCLGCKIVNNILWVEPKESLYGDDGSDIFDLGEVSEFSITPDMEHVFNTIKTGSPDQSYQGITQNDGKLEVNSTQEWLLPITSMKKEYDITSKARKDALGIEFIRQSLPSTGASYNSSDNDVFLIKVSNEVEQLAIPTLTSIQITVDTILSIPKIVFPSINSVDTIYNDKPLVSGYAIPSTMVGILIDGIQEGFCTSDANGFWSYQIVASLSSFELDGDGNITASGEHSIAASYTDGSGVVIDGGSSNTTANIVVNTMVDSNFTITSLYNNQTLIDNKPLIKGIGPHGAIVAIYLDSGLLGNVTIDNSCNWEYKVTTPLANNSHVVTATIASLSKSVTINFNVASSSATIPLITSLTNGQFIYSNLPLISGVASPNANVTLYLDFITTDDSGHPTHLATTTADSNGNWSVQITNAIGDGDHEISTTPDVEQVDILQSGYKLLYGAYDSISGVVDGTIFNIEGMTPKQCLLAHGSYIRSVNYQQQNGKIILTTAAKNKNLVTVTGGVTYSERESINIGKLADPFFLPWVFNLKTNVPYTFDQIMAQIPKGLIKFTVKGFPLYALPLGEMSYKPAEESAQTWKVLASAKNSLSTFMQLSESFLFIETYNKNMLSISNLNPLCWVKYNFQQDAKYNTVGIGDDLFINRFKNYLSRPNYFQKWQKSDTIRNQFITANIASLSILVYNSSLIKTGTYDMVASTTYVNGPYNLYEVSIPLGEFSEDNYCFVIVSDGVILGISEWCHVAEFHYGTGLIEYYSTFNKLNGYFSDGWRPMIRVEGLLSPCKPDSDFVDYENERKDVELLHAVPYEKYEFIIGKPQGIPDWMTRKLNEILLLNRWAFDGIRYVRTPDSKFEENILNGYTMAWYKTTIMKAINDSNLTINDTDLTVPVGGMVATLDGAAFGQADSVIQITINKE